MAFTAVVARAHLIAASSLLVIALVPWREAMRERPSSCAALIEPEADPWDVDGWAAEIGPLSIDIPNAAPVTAPNAFHSWDHPDMRPWPAGMVIHPRPSHDLMVLQDAGAHDAGAWDRWLSALLAPLLAAGSAGSA